MSLIVETWSWLNPYQFAAPHHSTRNQSMEHTITLIPNSIISFLKSHHIPTRRYRSTMINQTCVYIYLMTTITITLVKSRNSWNYHGQMPVSPLSHSWLNRAPPVDHLHIASHMQCRLALGAAAAEMHRAASEGRGVTGALGVASKLRV